MRVPGDMLCANVLIEKKRLSHGQRGDRTQDLRVISTTL